MRIDGKISRDGALLLLLMLSAIHAFPIIHADFPYIDDQWRSLHLDDDDWRNGGRFFTQLLYTAATLTRSTPNIFPMLLIFSLIAIAWAMRNLVFYLFRQVGVAHCLVVLPLFYSPFLLGNLTYQYDGPAMVFAAALMVTAITIKPASPVLDIILPGVLITIAMGLYQVTLSVWVALCCLEQLMRMAEKLCWREMLARITARAIQLMLGIALYYLTAFSLSNTHRGNLLAFDSNLANIVTSRLELTVETCGALDTPGTHWMLIAMLVLAGSGGLLWGQRCMGQKDYRAHQNIAIVAFFAFMFAIILLCIPGAMLILAENRLDARDLMGFSVFLMLIFYLALGALERIGAKAGLLLIIPCLYMLSVSYMYGQVLNAKKEFVTNLSSNIAYDLTTRAELKAISRFNLALAGDKENAYWVPGSEATLALTPVLRYILSSDNAILFPVRFARLGISNVFWDEYGLDRLIGSNSAKRVVDNVQYQIYLIDHQGLIQVNDYKSWWRPGQND